MFALTLMVLSTAQATPTTALLDSVPVALKQARKHNAVHYEESGQMQESFERAIETLHHMRQLRALHDDFLMRAHDAGYEGDLNAVVQALARTRSRDANRELYDLSSTLANVNPDQRIGVKNANAILDQVDMIAMAAEHLRPTMRMELAAELTPLYRTAVQFAPDHAPTRHRVEEMRTQVDQTVNTLIESARAELAAHRWPGGDTTSAVAKAGMTYLKQHPKWGADSKSPTQILRVSTHGSWYVATTNIFGQPTSYAHPAWLAVREPSTPEGIVHVLNVSLVTDGPAKNTVFGDVWTGVGVTQMLEANL